MSQPSSAERRPFGLTSASLLVVASMIGAGVFTTSGYSLRDLGDPRYVMLAWALAAVVALCGAIGYGLLARRITESGGEYVFLSRLVHPAVGFLAGWVSLLHGFTGAIAFAASLLAAYAIPPEWRENPLAGNGLAIASILIFGVVHSLVLRPGLLTQNLIVALKVAFIVGFIGFALWQLPRGGWAGWPQVVEPEARVEFSWVALASSMVWISLSFSGFNAAVYVTSEVAQPRKNVPRALLLGTVLVAVIYLLLNWIFLYAPPPGAIAGKEDIAAIAADSLGGPTLAWAVRVVICLALLSSVSSMIVAGPRVYAKMADDGIFPGFFRATERGGVHIPVRSIWLQVILASIVVYFSDLRSLLDYLGFTLSVSAALTVACLFWSTRQEPTRSTRSWIVTIGFLVAAVYVTSTLVLAAVSATERPLQLWGFVATIVSGCLMYAVLRFQARRRDRG